MDNELKERVRLIETMIAEGRRDTESWAWAFILWGVGHLVAVLWSQQASGGLAWGVTMTSCGVVMGAVAARRATRPGRKSTALGRALGSVWASLGVSIALIAVVGSMSGAVTGPMIWIVFFVLMGAASFSSGLILRWSPWTAMGILWWVAAAASMVATEEQLMALFIAMALVGEVGFGIFLAIHERREAAGVEAPGA